MIFTQHWLSWLIFFGIIGVLLYTLRTIDEEEELVDEEHQVFGIGNFQLKVPNWWTDNLTSSTAQTISFERTDTSYEWFAEFTWFLKANIPEGGLDDFLRQNMELEGMEFDLHEVVLTENDSYPHAEKFKDGTYQLYRIEGTATQNKTKRCYVDAFLLEDINKGEVLYGKSWSSILNGMLEGPYFEKALFNIIENHKK
jgi:hypothetical protein